MFMWAFQRAGGQRHTNFATIVIDVANLKQRLVAKRQECNETRYVEAINEKFDPLI